MEALVGLIDIETILALPWQVGLPGVLLICWLLWSAVRSILRLALFTAVLRAGFALVVAIMLSKGGPAIASFIATPPPS